MRTIKFKLSSEPNVIISKELVPIEELEFEKRSRSVILEYRDTNIEKYGLFLGFKNEVKFEPEVVLDESDCYVLIFKRR